MNMNDKTVRFKLEQDRRGFEPEKAREGLADHCVPPEPPEECGRRCPPAGELIGVGQARSSQVKAGQA